jgi:hypothetical protein
MRDEDQRFVKMWNTGNTAIIEVITISQFTQYPAKHRHKTQIKTTAEIKQLKAKRANLKVRTSLRE